jgi:hypothetical protein
MGKLFVNILNRIKNSIFRTFRQGIYDLKLWPNILPDVKYNSSTLGKIEPLINQEQILNNPTNKTATSTTTIKPPVIKWNDDNEYPMLDELSRIAKVRKKIFFKFYFI